MHELHGSETDRYWNAFALTWKFVNEHVADKEFGGWYDTTDAAGKVIRPAKSQNWKEGYHDGRALMNMEARLRALAEK
jgi:mannobiose 2-epimerase